MNDIYFRIVDDTVIKHTPMPEIGENMCRMVMNKDIIPLKACFKKWVESQESEVKE